MSLMVRTTHGQTFRRTGLAFTQEPTLVSDEQLKVIVVSATPKTKARTRREVLLAEPMLVCVDVPAEAGHK